jgi:hypothetical protein
LLHQTVTTVFDWVFSSRRSANGKDPDRRKVREPTISAFIAARHASKVSSLVHLSVTPSGPAPTTGRVFELGDGHKTRRSASTALTHPVAADRVSSPADVGGAAAHSIRRRRRPHTGFQSSQFLMDVTYAAPGNADAHPDGPGDVSKNPFRGAAVRVRFITPCGSGSTHG